MQSPVFPNHHDQAGLENKSNFQTDEEEEETRRGCDTHV